MRNKILSILPFLISAALHLGILLSVAFLSVKQEGGTEGMNGNAKHGVSEPQGTIVPKSIEIEVFTPPKDEGELKTEKSQEKSEGVKECVGNLWFGGIGVVMAGFSHNGEEIGEVFAGYPASKVGLQKGDVVQLVDGQPYNHGEIRGEPGTSLILTIYRPSTNETKDYYIVREKICTQESI